jgi:methionyl-tRNA formyltransferase
MRIVFVGAVAFSRRCLAEVLDAGGGVVGVLTLAPEDASFNADYVDLEPLARKHGIPVWRIRHIRDAESVALLRELEPDVVFVFGWSQLVPAHVLELAPLGFIGAHPALLPRGRGRHPIVWTLVEGLERSGLTFFYLDEGADSGDILWQGEFAVDFEDDAATVYAKVEELATRAIHEFLPQLATGTAPRVAQDERLATYWRKRNDDDRRIDWHAPSVAIYNLVRGLTRPYVGATTTCDGREIVIWRARPDERELDDDARAARPGTVLLRGGVGVDVRTGDSALTLIDVEPDAPALLRPGRVLGFTE